MWTERRKSRRERERERHKDQGLPLMLSIYLLNYPSFYKHLIPSHRQARAPVILLYFEELREVATRLGKVRAYYITADKIERVRKTGWEREKNREGESGNCFVVLVIRLSRCRPQRGAAEFKMRVAVNRVSVWCWCVCVFVVSLCMQWCSHWKPVNQSVGGSPRGSEMQPCVKPPRILPSRLFSRWERWDMRLL